MQQRFLDMIATIAIVGEFMTKIEALLKAIEKALKKMPKDNHDPPIVCEFEGHIFRAHSLPELKLQIQDYVAREILEEKIGVIYPDKWKDAKIGNMPTWSSVTLNGYRILHRDIIQPRTFDCSGIVRWHDEIHEWK